MNEGRARSSSFFLTGAISLAWLLALGGCEVGPDYHRPNPGTAPPQWKASAPWKQGEPRDKEIKPDFWEVFDDSTLSSLERQATTNSPDVRAAFQRIEEARAAARITRADLMPTVTANPSYYNSYYSVGRSGQPGIAILGYSAEQYAMPLDMSYEIDLWGRVRRSFRAAREQAQATAADYRTILLSLQANIAQTYFQIRSVDLDRRVVAESIDLRKKNLSLVESLHSGGAGSEVDVAEAETELASAEAQLIGLNLNRAQLENALGTLVGEPATVFSIAETNRFYRPPPIPVAMPSDLLERRPDVARAERAMAAASENIGVAKAAYFPSIQLTGAAGTESVNLRGLFNWENRFWSLGPNITMPIFEGGRIKSDVQRAKAAYDESVAQYRSQVMVSFHEVEDGLIGLKLLKDQFDAQMRAVNAAKVVADQSRLRYKEGLASYIEVVIADRTVLDNEVTAYELNGNAMVTTVSLIKALGGGWSTNAPLMDKSVAPISR